MDFKGWFRTGDGNRCDPFTITDAYSRYLIRCQAVARMDTAHILAICEAAMREYGVPERIRTDNGNPFSGLGVMGLLGGQNSEKNYEKTNATARIFSRDLWVL